MKSFKQYIITESKKIKNDATKFEGDLIAAMGAADPGSTNASWAPPDPDDPNVQLASGIVKKMIKNGVSVKGARRASGGGGQKDLTKLYLDMGAKSGEPKTDVIFGGMNVSVKQADSAQISAAQGPECAALIQASVLHDPAVSKEAIKLSKEAAKLVKEVSKPANFYKMRGGSIRPSELRARLKYGVGRGKLPDKVKKRLQNKEKKLGSATDEINQMLGFSDKKPSPAQMAVFKGWARQFGIADEMAKQLPTFLGSEAVKRGIFLEAATGKYKFKKKTSIANYMFAWGTDVENPGYALETADEFVSSMLSGGLKYKYRVSDRGGITSARGFKLIKKKATDDELTMLGRGAGWRLEVRKIPLFNDYNMVDLDDETKEYITEMADELAESHREFLTENPEFAQEMLLQEGLIDTVKDKLKQGIDALVAKFRQFFIIVGRWFARLARNVGVFMTAFDINSQVVFKYKWIKV